MNSFKLRYFIIFLLNIYIIEGLISDKRLCVDEKCLEPVSLGKTLIKYNSPEKYILSFDSNTNVKIFSKEAGSRSDLWGVEIHGQRGYIPKAYVREYKVLKKPHILVDTEIFNVNPDKVKEPFEVVDGTTLFIDPGISPSSTENSVISTTSVDIQEKQDSQEIVEKVSENENHKHEKSHVAESTIEESVVDGVFSSIKNWINEDDNDDEDDEEINEEDKREETNRDPLIKKQEINLNKLELNEVESSSQNIEKNIDVDILTERNIDIESNKNIEESLSQDIESNKNIEESLSQNIDANKQIEESSSENIESNKKIEESSSQKIENGKTIEEFSSQNIESDIKIQEFLSQNIEKNVNVDIVTERNIDIESTKKIDSATIESLKTSADGSVKQNQIFQQVTEQNDFLKVTNIDVTTQSIVDNNEIIPIVSAEEITPTPDPVQLSTAANVLSSPILESLNTNNQIENIISEQSSPFSTIESKESADIKKVENEMNNDADILIEDNITQINENVVSTKPEGDKDDDNNYDKLIEYNISNDNNPIIDDHISIDNINEIQENFEEGGEIIEEKVVNPKGEEAGLFSGMFSLLGGSQKIMESNTESPPTPISSEKELIEKLSENHEHITFAKHIREEFDTKNYCSFDTLDKLKSAKTDTPVVLYYLSNSIIASIIALIIYIVVDRITRQAPLVKKINELEKKILLIQTETDTLQEGVDTNKEFNLIKEKLKETNIYKENLEIQILSLQKEVEEKHLLEEHIESLEKELETSTEVGLELNRIISEMLDPTKGGEKLKENVEQLQRQLLEQKVTINDLSQTLNEQKSENSDLLAELDISRKKTYELQSKVDEILEKLFNVEKERDQELKNLQEAITLCQQKLNDEQLKTELLNNEIQDSKSQLQDAQRKAELKVKEYQILKETLNNIKSFKNDKDALKSLLDVSSIKAELEQLKIENDRYCTHIRKEEIDKIALEKKYQTVIEEKELLMKKYQDSEKEKVETTMKLEVLNTYFKKREEELQSELLKYKSIWNCKEGEATSTTERIKLMLEEIENYKAQNETLKQEIVSQEIDLKSQISMLEKKVHENWVTSRQMERKLEDARHESAQLRNRITLRERAFVEERTQNRLQSPLDQNGELALSPPPLESPASPPMLFSGRDHITKSPPLPPFLPPPPGVQFMPPPLPFMPPPPALFPGDHRPPPLGRMSSPPPPLNSRYSPETSAFSPYDRNTPSPAYDSEYGASPPPIRGYSPYNSRNDRREYKRPIHASNGKTNKGSFMSSGSDNSNDSIGKVNMKQSKMV